jgi:hypothetical protein
VRPPITIALVLTGIALLACLQEVDANLRARDVTVETGRLPPGVAAAALGGLRTPVLCAMWLEADRLFREKRWWALRSHYELIVQLEPRIPAAWGFIADRMILNLADRVRGVGPRAVWAWTREGLTFIERGIAANPGANPESYKLRLQHFGRLLTRLAPNKDLCARFRAWKGRSVREEALRVAAALAALYPGDEQEAMRAPTVLRCFAIIAFHRARGLEGPDRTAAREAWRVAAEQYRETEAALRDHATLWGPGSRAENLDRLAETFIDLCVRLAEIPARDARARLIRERLGPFTGYDEVHAILRTL